MSQARDDDIDLFELFETIWNGKWIIVSAIALGALVGFCYSKTIQTKYKVSVPFVVEVYSLENKSMCGRNAKCIQDRTAQKLVTLLGVDWTHDASTIFLQTKNPLNLTEYETKFDRANNLLTEDARESAVNKLALIKTEFNDTLLGTETVAANILEAMYVIEAIGSGKSVLRFGAISMQKIVAQTSKIVAMSTLLGMTGGVFFVLFSKVMRNRKEDQLSM